MTNKVLKLQTQNFRNLDSEVLSFSEGINCIFGENGNGKTNILEAIYYLGNGKSFRKNTSFPQLLSVDGENPEVLISAVFTDRENNPFSYSMKLDQNGVLLSKNGAPIKRKLQVPSIFINPFDSFSFHNTPSFRRNWIDQHLSILDAEYKKTLSRYTQSLRFRNNLLSKKPYHFQEQIKANDPELVRLSCFLTERRQSFLLEMADFCRETFKNIFSEEHDLKIELDTRVNSKNPDSLQSILLENLEKDSIIGHTSYGIHKDDYILLFDGMNSYDYCSLGQQKMSYLSLLFAYVELFRYKFKSFPIVLIDDVSGELDSFRWTNLVNFLKEREFQVFITTANEKFKEELERIREAKRLYVKQGTVEFL